MTVSSKLMKEMSIDRLSALLDGVLLHILSFLGFYNVECAAVTSVLSKRWLFLWSELPRLNFYGCSFDVGKTRDFVSWVYRTIILHSGSYLEKFTVNFYYDECYALDVNVWVRFAVQNKVKDLSLLCSHHHFYTLPQVLYSDSSLTRLCLKRCIVAPHGIIEWRCLTRLTVEDVELPEDVIGKILAGCRVLYRLTLKWCWGFKRLDVNSESLHELRVLDYCSDKRIVPSLEISAPYLHSLDIVFPPLKKKLQLGNVKSLVCANISVYDNSLEEMNNLKELFEKL